MKFYGHMDRIIGENLYAENIKESKAHQSSGKISPSKLAYPSQTAVLALLGVPPDPINHKVLGIFRRGKEVEQSVLRAYKAKKGFADAQILCKYREAVGYSDLQSEGFTYEIKSTTQKKFWNLARERQPQPSHAIQTTFYAAAHNQNKGWLCYVSADSYATLELPIYRQIWQSALDYRIDVIHAAIRAGKLPDFIALEPFHKVKQYNPYNRFFGLKGEKAERILAIYYPEIFRKLKDKELKKICQAKSPNIIHSQAELNIYLTEISTAEIVIMPCGANCVSCSILRLNPLLEITEQSRVYFIPCLRLIK